VLFFSITFLAGARMAVAQPGQDLGLRLVGTAVTEEPGRSFAIIEVRSTKRQAAFHEGYRWGNILIKKIEPGRVVIRTEEGETILYMTSGEGAERLPSSPELAYLDRSEVESLLPDYTKLMQEVRVRPRFEGGQPLGFVIYKIVPGSIFERMGLKDGDIIVGVNGNPFATTQQTVEFYEALKKGGKVSLEVMRGESKRDLQFEIQ